MKLKVLSIVVFVVLNAAVVTQIYLQNFSLDSKNFETILALIVIVLSTLLLILGFQNNNKNATLVNGEVNDHEDDGLVKTNSDAEEIVNKIQLSDDVVNVTGDEAKFFSNMLVKLSQDIEIVQGLLFVKQEDEFVVKGTYAFYDNVDDVCFEEGNGLSGQIVAGKKAMVIDSVPDEYIRIVSGLGKGKPKKIMFLPLKKDDAVVGLIELATFKGDIIDIEHFYEKINDNIVTEIEKRIN